MKAAHLLVIFLVFLCTFGFISCNDDERADKKETIKMLVSSETSIYLPWGASETIECMLVKEENQSEYSKLNFLAIIGYEYEKGYEYKLLVEKTTLANPPADDSNINYKLIEILSKIKTASDDIVQ